ncbi:MAG: TetR/AcrR family transcriptional regulator [Actinobacteria bacterium]|nr:TetR/AcrR family transcriptional regulator [Actinomycetota bacterium]
MVDTESTDSGIGGSGRPPHAADESGVAPAGLRERKKQLRRQAIHESALRLIEQQGLDGTTVEQICESVGVSPRTFFNYFPSKAAAAMNLPEHVVDPEAAAVFLTAEGELVPALCELIAISMYAGVEHKRLKKLVAKQPELMPAFSQWMATVKDEFAQLVGRRAASPADAGAAVALTLGALSLLVHEPAQSDRPAGERLQETVDRIVAIRHAPMIGG